MFGTLRFCCIIMLFSMAWNMFIGFCTDVDDDDELDEDAMMALLVDLRGTRPIRAGSISNCCCTGGSSAE